MPRMIAAYLADLDRALAFDPALAARVHDEIEDHLLTAVEHAPEQDVVARFGEPAQIARSYATAGWADRLRRAWLASLALLAATFLLMRARALLLDLPYGAGGAMAWLDRGAFFAGLVCVAIAGMVAWHSRFATVDSRIRTLLHGGCAALVLSIAASLLRALPLVGSGVPAALVVASALVELTLVALLLRHLNRLGSYAACIAH